MGNPPTAGDETDVSEGGNLLLSSQHGVGRPTYYSWDH